MHFPQAQISVAAPFIFKEMLRMSGLFCGDNDTLALKSNGDTWQLVTMNQSSLAGCKPSELPFLENVKTEAQGGPLSPLKVIKVLAT